MNHSVYKWIHNHTPTQDYLQHVNGAKRKWLTGYDSQAFREAGRIRAFRRVVGQLSGEPRPSKTFMITESARPRDYNADLDQPKLDTEMCWRNSGILCFSPNEIQHLPLNVWQNSCSSSLSQHMICSVLFMLLFKFFFWALYGFLFHIGLKDEAQSSFLALETAVEELISPQSTWRLWIIWQKLQRQMELVFILSQHEKGE